MDEIYREAAGLANDYNWPDQARDLRHGLVPDGFGRTVGLSIRDFLWRGPLWALGKAPAERDMYDKECRAHAKRLARLRVLVALIRFGSHE